MGFQEEALSMSVWDELRNTQDASVLSNKGFLSLQCCHHHVRVGCGMSECLSRDQSEEVTAENRKQCCVNAAQKS